MLRASPPVGTYVYDSTSYRTAINLEPGSMSIDLRPPTGRSGRFYAIFLARIGTLSLFVIIPVRFVHTMVRFVHSLRELRAAARNLRRLCTKPTIRVNSS